MVVNWKTAESKERLLAAVTASLLPAKVDYNKVAKYFGKGATYNAIEGQFRSVRKLAETLHREAETGVSSDATTPTPAKAAKRTASGKKKESSAMQGVIGGRVSKSKSTSKSVTPKASRKAARMEDFVKSEGTDSGYDDFMDGFIGTAEELETVRDMTSSDEMFSLHEYGNETEDLYQGL